MAEVNPKEIFRLEMENELRILVGDQQCYIVLMSGFAEIYGTEMESLTRYRFPPGSSISIFTWQGCTVSVTGQLASSFIDNDSFMILNVVLHAFLEERRIKALTENTKGPVTLVVGPKDSGKSTLCRVLLNYAARLVRKPFFVDLDVGQNSITIPGSVGILNIDKPAHVVQGFQDETAQVFQFGHKSPGHNMPLYLLLLKQMGRIVKSRVRKAAGNIKSSGVVINTCGWTRGLGYEAITCAAMAFEIDFLCVLGEERLYSQLKRDMPSSVKVLYIPKMKGVLERDQELRSRTRDLRVREYFCGPNNEQTPFTVELLFSQITILKVTPRLVTNDVDSETPTSEHFNLKPLDLSLRLVNQVLGVSSNTDMVRADVMCLHVYGFVFVRHVDIRRGVITVLAPEPAPLPSNIFLVGEIRLIEEIMA